MTGLISDSALFAIDYDSKGVGKGLAKGDGKGKGKKGFGKGKNPTPARPAPKTEEELLEEAYTKTRKMRDICAKLVANMEEQVNTAAATKFWSKAAQKDATGMIEALGVHVVALKKVLVKKNLTVDELQEKVLSAAAQVKKSFDYLKEVRQIANKTSSKHSAK